MTFPTTLLSEFFKKVIESLHKVPNHPTTAVSSDATRIPIQKHRETLLQLQLEILSSLVEDYNQDHDTDTHTNITLEQAQAELKELGSPSSAQNELSPPLEILTLMEEMNDAARTALVRLVLRSEWDFWERNEAEDTELLVGQSEGDVLDPSDIASFCALCIKAVSLPEVTHYLEYGGDLTFQSSASSGSESESELESIRKEPLEIQKRMMTLQNMLYRSVGYDPDFAMAEITSLLTKPPVTQHDMEIVDTITDCMSIMRQAFETVTLERDEFLSDETEGGCTRVVSVTFSEHDVDPTSSGTSSGQPPAQTQQRMEEHVEETQRRNLEVARQAASLQQGILGELLQLRDEERLELLEQAKQTHDSFMAQAMEIPVGPDRIQFLQTLTGAKQRLLVMHKLWEKLLADNGGEPPPIRTE